MGHELELRTSGSNTNKFARFLGHAFVTCVIACLCAIMIALAIRFIAWVL